MHTYIQNRATKSMNLPQLILSYVALAIVQLRHRGWVKGVMISPPGVAPVCSGDILELTCTTPGSLLEWSFFLIPERERAARRYSRILSSLSVTPVSDLEVNSVTFTFSRISAAGSQPLISRLVINPVSDGLNGTEVNCTDILASNSTSTRIKVINESILISSPENQTIKVTTLSEHFSKDVITVILKLAEINSLYSYHISAIPQLLSHTFVEGNLTVVQIKVSYNVRYNVSILAASPCGKNNVTKFTEVYYANCGDPTDQVDSTLVDVMGYTDPAVEGSYITVICSSGYLWNGTFEAVCLENGNWEPELKDISFNCSDQYVVKGEMDSNVVVGAIVGAVVCAVVLVVLVSLVIMVTCAFRLRARDMSEHRMSQDGEYYERYALNTESSFNTHHDKSPSSSLVYADIGQSSFRQQHSHLTITQLLDDDAVEYAQLNHNISVTSAPLTTNVERTENSNRVNLDNLLIHLRPQVTFKWRQFGETVGIEKEVLDSCAKTCYPEDCIVEMLDYWLRNSVEKPTWKVIAEALKAINLPQLAHDIEMVYSTGNFPVNTDMNRASEIQKGSFDEGAAEIPPPIPPKMIENNNRSLPEPSVVAETQASESVPALPPKPVNNYKNVFH